MYDSLEDSKDGLLGDYAHEPHMGSIFKRTEQDRSQVLNFYLHN